MSFESSLSGLNSSSLAIDVTSNNLANSGTIGFKMARTQFADVFASAISTSAGLGVTTSGVAQIFKQGEVTRTENPLDMAINGRGFFRVSDDGAIAYTRNGQFRVVGELDAAGGDFSAAELANQNAIVVNSAGLHLTGYLADYSTDPSGTIDKTTAPQDIVIQPDMPGAETTSVDMKVNLDAAAKQPLTAPFDPLDSSSYNFGTLATVYDAAGAAHSLNFFFVQSATPNVWDVYATLEGQTLQNSITFDSFGKLTPASATMNLSFGTPVATVTFDLTGSTQYAEPSGVNALEQDGYANGRITGVSVTADGMINATYSNAQVRKAAQLALATFNNPEGLRAVGNNLWAETRESGTAQLDTPNNPDPLTSLGLGAINGMAVEEANVDISAEMVNLIVQQRYYQANAQGIKAQDQLLQTLSGIR